MRVSGVLGKNGTDPFVDEYRGLPSTSSSILFKKYLRLILFLGNDFVRLRAVAV